MLGQFYVLPVTTGGTSSSSFSKGDKQTALFATQKSVLYSARDGLAAVMLWLLANGMRFSQRSSPQQLFADMLMNIVRGVQIKAHRGSEHGTSLHASKSAPPGLVSLGSLLGGKCRPAHSAYLRALARAGPLNKHLHAERDQFLR